MKKLWILSLLVALLFVCPIQAGTYTENASRLPYGLNYLDLRNFILNNNDLDMRVPITVKVDTTYTLILDKNFVGYAIFEQNEEPVYTLTMGDDTYSDTPLTIDLERNIWYHTFTTKDTSLLISDLMANADIGYNFMLYEGTIEDFTRFEMYISYPPTYEEGYYLVDYDNPVVEENIRKSITFYDNATGTAGSLIKVSDNYTSRTDKTGSFSILYKIEDSRNNTSFFNLTVRVVDIVKPVLTGKTSYTAEASVSVISLATMKAGITITDNVDTINSDDLVVYSDTYTGNESTPGTYLVTFMAQDAALNQSFLDVNITVTDTQRPMISGPSAVFTYLHDTPLTEAYILSLFTAYDSNDGDITSKLTVYLNGYQGNFLTVYEVYIMVTDLAGNKATFPFKIHILDDVAPEFRTDELILTEETVSSMTTEDIIAYLEEKLLDSGLNARNIHILLNEYNYLSKPQEKSYIYYSYDIEGVTYQSRILVTGTVSETGFNMIFYYIIGASLLIGSASIYFIYKRRKRV